MNHTRQLAERIISQLEHRANILFTLIGSVAEKGESNHDIDLLWPSAGEAESAKTGEEKDFRFRTVMEDMGFQCLGRTDYGETWRRGDGIVVDFWEFSPDEMLGDR
jgi:hypothetical protein